ncbi:hypothetical protein CAEBREN_03986 [Caenorhabditis brenneri]|uniref:Uncharacterized protein n=1 Tax=Caenorhabditis brenneri TaxID=135651 RepID=G0MGS8_CAEBE|nr:hypothetical protein CAEBREN_03986 [Caenorhabditis brenneri]
MCMDKMSVIVLARRDTNRVRNRPVNDGQDREDMATVAPEQRSNLYPLLERQRPDEPRVRRKRRTYWSKYPNLKLLKGIGNRRFIFFIFFAYLFLLTTSEFTENTKFGARGLITLQTFMTLFTTGSVLMFDYGLKTCSYQYFIPFMSVVMGALSCYICLFGMVFSEIINSPPFAYLLLCYNCYIFFVTTTTTFILIKGTEVLWHSFFTLVDLNRNREILEKLKTNAPIDPNDEKNRRNGRYHVITAYVTNRRRFF